MIYTLALALVLAQSTKVGKYEITLRPPADGIYAAEETQLEFRVVDTTNEDPLMGFAPVVRAKIESAIDMPAMAGMPVILEIAHPEGVPGEYGLHPSFVHGGEFRLKLNIAPPAGEPFTAEFLLPVKDARAKRGKLDSQYRLKLDRRGDELELRISDANGLVKDFDIQHEKKMHLVVVDKDLRYFIHTHPELGADGVFRIKDTFPGGDLRFFADAAPKGKGAQVTMMPLKHSGKPEVTSDNVAVRAKLSGALTAGRSSPLTLEGGLPLGELEPYLGAMAHLIMIHEDAETYVHAHPLDDPKKIVFLARPPKPGRYKGWVELQSKGKVLRQSFELEASDERR